MVGHRGLEPRPAGYEPDALTNWANGPESGRDGDLNPRAHWLQTSCATKLRHTPAHAILTLKDLFVNINIFV